MNASLFDGSYLFAVVLFTLAVLLLSKFTWQVAPNRVLGRGIGRFSGIPDSEFDEAFYNLSSRWLIRRRLDRRLSKRLAI